MKLSHTLAFLAVPALVATAPLGATMQGTGASPADKEANETSADPNKLICKRDKVVGSRLSAKKVCMTAAEWERQRREDQQLAERVQANRSKSN